MTTPCLSCGARIFFARTEKGKSMPLDAEPVPDGNIVLRDGVVNYLTGPEMDMPTDRPRYKSHYATCPQAGQWRKK